MREALMTHRKERPQRPFICVLPATEADHHYGFLERLLAFSLPRILKPGSDKEVTEFWQVQWPTESLNAEEHVRRLANDLAYQLDCPTEQITSALNRGQSPVVVCYEILAGELGGDP